MKQRTRQLTDADRENRIVRIASEASEYDPGDAYFHECTLLDFVSDNRDDPDVCRVVESLGRGGMTYVGGGAAPLFRVFRVK